MKISVMMMIWLGSIRDDDMARQYKKMYAQGNALIRKCYMCTGDVKCTLLNCTVLHYIHVSYGIIINRNQ